MVGVPLCCFTFKYILCVAPSKLNGWLTCIDEFPEISFSSAFCILVHYFLAVSIKFNGTNWIPRYCFLCPYRWLRCCFLLTTVSLLLFACNNWHFKAPATSKNHRHRNMHMVIEECLQPYKSGFLQSNIITKGQCHSRLTLTNLGECTAAKAPVFENLSLHFGVNASLSTFIFGFLHLNRRKRCASKILALPPTLYSAAEYRRGRLLSSLQHRLNTSGRKIACFICTLLVVLFVDAIWDVFFLK